MKVLFSISAFLFIGNPATTVFICDSPTAEVYHFSKECKGIKKCSHEVKELSLEEAKEMGRRICGLE